MTEQEILNIVDDAFENQIDVVTYLDCGEPEADVTGKQYFLNEVAEKLKKLFENKDTVNILDEISKLEINGYWSYPTDIPTDDINDLLQEIGIAVDITEDMNGHDMDWSIIDPYKHNNMEFEIWGCATSGSFMFQRRK